MTEPERQQLLVDWNDTTTAYPQEASLPTLFAMQVAERPEAIAVVCGEEQLTYGQLDRRSTQLAHYMRRQGVGPETRVGVCLERGVDLLGSLLAILKAGGAYVPLDPNAPASRLASLIDDAAVGLVLTHERHGESLPSTMGRVLVLDEPLATLAQEPVTPVGLPVSSGQLAYIMYTSGSTGQPKGTLISQRSVVRLVKATNYVQLGAADRVGHLANAAFDAMTFEVWGPLLNGGVVVVFHQDEVLVPPICASRILQHEITAMFLTTALFNQLAREVPTVFSTVETVLFGGEQVDRQWVAAVLQSDPLSRLGHVYGPTESTTFATWHPVKTSDLEAATVPIGQPIANTQGYVVDQARQLVPVGVPGELLIGGEGLAWGYLNQPALTAEKFIPHPFSQAPGARVYKTGDQVRWRDTGVLEFLGRQDTQIKLRGYRIELGEIEAVLSQHPQVHEAVVLCREEVPGDKQVVAYVTTGQEPIEEPALRGYLQGRLPGYMVPASFVMLDALPLTPNGKVDRRALPSPAGTRALLETSYVAPRTPMEQQLVDIWQEVLGLEQVGIYDNFFELGGHSLLATQVVSRVHHAFHLDLRLRDFFELPTISNLADALEALSGSVGHALKGETQQDEHEEIGKI